jgi:hypothetical protein
MDFLNFNFRNEDIFIMALFMFIIILASVICYMSAQVNKKPSTQSEKKAGAAVQQTGYPLPKSGVKPEDKIKEQAEAKDKKNRQLSGGRKEAKTEVRSDPTLPKITIKQELPVSQINNQSYQQTEEPKSNSFLSTKQEPVLQQNPQELEKLTENRGESEENGERNKEKSLYDLFNDDSEEETEINKFASNFEDVNLDSIIDTGNDLLTQIKSNMN